MRVLSIGSLPPRSGGSVHGGVATFHAALLEGLERRGSGIELVGVAPPAPLGRVGGPPIFTRPPEATTADFYEGLLARLHPDVVLMNHFAHTIGVTHARLRPSATAVGIAHSWHSVTLREGAERERAARIASEALTGLGALVAGSRHCLREGESLGFSYPAVAEVIHYPLQPFYAEAGVNVDARARAGVAYLGSLIPRKQPLALAEAAESLPELDFCFAGHGELEQPLLSRIDSLSPSGRVRIADLDDHGVRELLLQSEVMCLPSSSETFGLAYIEALACGTPVVGFGPTVREIRDLIGIEIGEPLDSGEPLEIAAAIERVLAVEWSRPRLRRATIETFGLARVAERYAELLHRIARPPAAEPD